MEKDAVGKPDAVADLAKGSYGDVGPDLAVGAHLDVWVDYDIAHDVVAGCQLLRCPSSQRSQVEGQTCAGMMVQGMSAMWCQNATQPMQASYESAALEMAALMLLVREVPLR